MTNPTAPTISRRALMQGLLAAGGIAALPGFLSSCSDGSDGDAGSATGTGSATGSSTPGGVASGSLAAALPGSISTLDVTREAGILNYTVALLAQESLLGIDETGALIPSLASSWSQPDETTYIFQLREDVTFSDGTPLTVDDVVASLEINTAEGSTSALAYAFTGIASAEQTGDFELTITLSEPNAAFGWTMSPGTFQVTSRAFIEENGDAIGTPKVLLMGTGPYVITGFSPDSNVTLRANPSWWGGGVEVDEVKISFIPEESTRQLAMRQGDIAMATGVALDQISQWEQIDGVDVQTTTDNSLVTLAFNTAIAPFDELAVRRAVAGCVDRAGIVNSLLDGQGIVASTIPSPQQWGGVLDAGDVEALYAEIPTVDFDIEAARAELATSSVPDGFSTTVTYPNSGPAIGTALLSIAENLGKIGVKLDVQEITLEQWIAELGAHTASIVLGWYFATTGDPAEYTHILLNGVFTGEGGTNIAEYDNPEVNDLLDRAQTSTDPAERGQLLGEALVTAGADVPYFPLWWGTSATAFGPDTSTDSYGPYFFIGPWATQVTTTG